MSNLNAELLKVVEEHAPAALAKSVKKYVDQAEKDKETILDLKDEVKDLEKELRESLNLDPRMISINNRNILQLEMDSGDVKTTEKLAKLVPKQVLLVSASSIKTREEIIRALSAGADAVLIGTTLMKAPSIQKKMQELIGI